MKRRTASEAQASEKDSDTAKEGNRSKRIVKLSTDDLKTINDYFSSEEESGLELLIQGFDAPLRNICALELIYIIHQANEFCALMVWSPDRISLSNLL